MEKMDGSTNFLDAVQRKDFATALKIAQAQDDDDEAQDGGTSRLERWLPLLDPAQSEDLFLRTFEFCRNNAEFIEVVTSAFEKSSSRDLGLDMHFSVDGFTPLSVASSVGNVDAVRVLLAKGADPNLGNDRGKGVGGTPLLCACSGRGNEKLEIARLLLGAGSDVNALGPRHKETALHLACFEPVSVEMVRLLLQSGADPNVQMEPTLRTPLVIAAVDVKSYPIARVLLEEAKADPNIPNSGGWTPLLALCYQPFKYDEPLPWARLLLRHNSNPNASVQGNTPLVMLLFQMEASDLQRKLVELLLESGADPNQSHGKIGTSDTMALIIAASKNNVPVARLLLANGADVNWRDSDDDTALRIAIASSHIDMARLLLENGADPSLKYADDKTLLRMAVEGGDIVVIRLLQEFHAEFSDDLEMREASPSSVEFGAPPSVRFEFKRRTPPGSAVH